MADLIPLTLYLRQPAASKEISDRLLSGTYDPAATDRSEISADPADVQAVTDFATSHHLQIVRVDPAARTVRVAGTATDIQNAFGIRAENAEQGSLESLNYKGPVNLPSPLDSIVIAVLGMDHTAIARHH